MHEPCSEAVLSSVSAFMSIYFSIDVHINCAAGNDSLAAGGQEQPD